MLAEHCTLAPERAVAVCKAFQRREKKTDANSPNCLGDFACLVSANRKTPASLFARVQR
jgi:hypothetical protein